MKTAGPKAIFLKDYREPAFEITDVFLTFNLHPTETVVESRLKIRTRPGKKKVPLILNGEELKFLEASLDGKSLPASEYSVGPEHFTLHRPPKKFELTIKNMINPQGNSALDGLYLARNLYCTQNEPEGFRRITYFLDRPDVMARYTTKIIADKAAYPVLLSNGNPIASGELPSGRHFVEWHDPFPKPCYLYALVAGDLGMIQDYFTTKSGRKIALRIYCDKGVESRCQHAMNSLKESMKWDEDTFGLEYDLDIFMIVAVGAFNMGAMENKGLNIFNSAFVLADTKSATDDDFHSIQGVIGHEYFHNWTGNRVTCRDWFQLTLKEGLTVFRDQEFTSDLGARAVDRIHQVARLRAAQFPEDQGPNAHPIRPASYIEINNFYTPTVYEKGAEVIRMTHTMLGAGGFRKGMDRYFKLYDGQAVTTDDFLHALSVANRGYDFSQFKRWYKQAGTPKLKASWQWKKARSTFELTLEQSCAPSKGQPKKLPLHFPLRVGLLSGEGAEIPIKLETLHVRKKKETFVFKNVKEKPIPSLNRSFSAPVILEAPYAFDELAFLMANDTDAFNRYEASQVMGTKVIMDLAQKKLLLKKIPQAYFSAYRKLLLDSTLDDSLKAKALTLPPEGVLHLEGKTALIHPIHQASTELHRELARQLRPEMQELYTDLYLKNQVAYSLDPVSVGRRALKNKILHYLAQSGSDGIALAFKQYQTAKNFTDQFAALQALIWWGSEQERNQVSGDFYGQWKHDNLTIQKWIGTHVSVPAPDALKMARKLEQDPVFDNKIPNFVRVLYGSFRQNHAQFHRLDGEGYQFISDRITQIDKINPQMASGLAKGFSLYHRLPPELKKHMKVALDNILAVGPSKNTFEIVSKTRSIS
ncbi:MAG: aminopeptidase N [Bdellovibrionales bacterium GWA2_49_15]|nr:MAG: aminopeptidase N [Bdellovibrionales bacterium GWA2_49_15]HAZ11742.1 aminopeptidase N [Bdellovibrionales bacterium]